MRKQKTGKEESNTEGKSLISDSDKNYGYSVKWLNKKAIDRERDERDLSRFTIKSFDMSLFSSK